MTPEALKLDVHIQGDDFHDFKNIAIMYRVHFRLTSTNLNTKFLNPLPSNTKETVLLQIEDDKPQVFTPKLLKRDEITIPDAIELEDAQHAYMDKSRQMNDIGQIIEERDRQVLLRFRSFRESTNPLDTSTSRKSFSDFQSARSIPPEEARKYRFGSLIPKQVIKDPPSPSTSGIAHGCNVLANPKFTIDCLHLRKIITLPVMLPRANGSNKLIETLEKRLNKLR